MIFLICSGGRLLSRSSWRTRFMAAWVWTGSYEVQALLKGHWHLGLGLGMILCQCIPAKNERGARVIRIKIVTMWNKYIIKIL